MPLPFPLPLITIRPHLKKHKEYLFILTLYSRWTMPTIVTILNRRFPRHHTCFGEEVTQDYYDYCRRTGNRIWRWAKGLGDRHWRVRRVMRFGRGVVGVIGIENGMFWS